MSTKCANAHCSACHHPDEGKLFRLDLEIANTAGATQLRTVFVWLCSRCAREMNPRVEVAGNTVRVLLATIHGAISRKPAAATVN